MKRFLIWLIKGYKKHISPHLGENCRFQPTCSEYTMQAIEIHGSVKGLVLGSWRIMRCNPFGKVGYDPPPPKGSWKNTERHVWRDTPFRGQASHTSQSSNESEAQSKNNSQ